MDSFENFTLLLREWFEAQNISSSLQERLYAKLCDSVFDAGDSFSLALVEESGDEEEAEDNDQGKSEERENEIVADGTSAAKSPEEGLSADAGEPYVLLSNKDLRAGEDIWLVDHCCTFRLRDFREHLAADGALRERLARILSVRLSNSDAGADTQVIFDHMWSVVGSYRLPAPADAGDEQYDSYWFIHDEVGSAISAVAEDVANMKLEPMPVLFPQLGGVLSVMWCVGDMTAGTIATRAARSVEALGDASTTHRRTCVDAWQRHVDRLEAIKLRRGQLNGLSANRSPYPPLITSVPLRVYTDSRLVMTFLTDTEHFVLVDLPQEADVVWVAHNAIKDSGEYPQAMFISQFLEERLFTNKAALLHLVQDTLGYADWYQVSYDAVTQLQEFIGDYTVRQAQLDGLVEDRGDLLTQDHVSRLCNDDGTNIWITKPINMARSIDMTVSANLHELLKTIETGPKVVCKYIANTATLRQRKFDLRFIVAVRSFTTRETAMEAYVYNVFWTRFAIENYSLGEFDRYEKHWTVMNYANPEKLLQLHYDAFVPEFNAEYAAKGYGEALWETTVYPKILSMLRGIFSTIQLGVNNSRSRSIYGVDVMLRETTCKGLASKTLEPSLLEINYSPDCQRACKYHPEFFNDVFNTLFAGSPANMTRL